VARILRASTGVRAAPDVVPLDVLSFARHAGLGCLGGPKQSLQPTTPEPCGCSLMVQRFTLSGSLLGAIAWTTIPPALPCHSRAPRRTHPPVPGPAFLAGFISDPRLAVRTVRGCQSPRLWALHPSDRNRSARIPSPSAPDGVQASCKASPPRFARVRLFTQPAEAPGLALFSAPLAPCPHADQVDKGCVSAPPNKIPRRRRR